MPVLQYHIPGAAAGFLRMAGKRTLKPDREFTDEIYPLAPILVQMEHRSQLLRAENLLVIMQLHGTQPERDRNAGQSYQHSLLRNEAAAISG